MNREAERERTVGRYDCRGGVWEPAKPSADRSVRVLEDALYHVCELVCRATKLCHGCPVCGECMDDRNTDTPATLLARHYYGALELKQEGDVERW